MRRTPARSAWWVTGLAMVLASCGGSAAPTTTTTAAPSTTIDVVTTTSPPSTTTTSTTTTPPSSPPLIEEGDDNDVVAAFQFLLNCNGYGDLAEDGNFGPATLAAVEAAQEDLGRTVNGSPDEETFAELSRSCAESRQLEGEGTAIIVGNAAPGDPETLEASLLSDTTLKVTFTQGSGLEVNVTGADGNEVAPQNPTTWVIDTTQDYAIEIGSPVEPVTFAVTVELTVGERVVGDWILATDGLIYKGTKLALGSDAQTVIDKVFHNLGHGVRGAYDEFDTGWYAVTDPADMGLRGIFVEGFALLFFGPDPNNLDRAETFQRFRFVGPGLDAAGDPRPEDYATTAEGITVGDTLADLKAAYADDVTAGSNDAEYWYRLVYSTGDLCFYFDTENEPTDSALITEISSECRTG